MAGGGVWGGGGGGGGGYDCEREIDISYTLVVSSQLTSGAGACPNTPE